MMKEYKQYAVYARTAEESRQIIEYQKTFVKNTDISPVWYPAAYRLDIAGEACGYSYRADGMSRGYEDKNSWPEIEVCMNFCEWQVYLKQLELEKRIKKMEDEEGRTVAYELLKDLPRLQAGAKFTEFNHYWVNGDYNFSDAEVKGLTDWFKPIKELTKYALACTPVDSGDPFSFEISSEGVYVVDGQTRGKVSVATLRKVIESTSDIATYADWRILASRVDIGCKKGILVATLKNVLKLYEECADEAGDSCP